MKNNTFSPMANANTQMRGGQCYCSLSRKSYAFIMMILFSIAAIQAQTLVNRTWENLTGLPDTIDWKASLTDVDGNVVIAGNTLTAPGETALLITKYDREGIKLWTISYEYNGNTHNYATAITGDANGNLFVAGATSAGNLLFDFLTLSVDVNGNIVWAETYNGLSNLYDVPTAIALDNSGNVVVVGGSYGLTTQSDYLTVKYDANGSLQWAVSYDYTGLHDAPIQLKIDSNDNIIVTGASASAANNYDYTTIGYDTWGTQIYIDRQNIVGAGLDSPLAMIRDNAGNIYITGKVQNGTNIDIRTLKLNASFALQWAVSYDLAGLEDVGNDLTIDNLGNIYVVGYATNANGGREYVTIKYNPMGTQVWEQRMQAIDSTQKAEAVKIYADNTGKIYVAGTMEIGTEKMVVSVCYDNNGREKWLQNYSETMGSNDKVVGIDKDIYGSVYLISTVDNGSGTQYATVRYDGFETPKEVVYDVDSLPLYMDNQLIINFKPDSNSLKLAPFYDKRKIWGTLDEFVQTDAIATIADKLGIANLGKAKVEKIFKNLAPNDSFIVSRTGKTLRIPDFWATILIYLPVSAPTLTGTLTDETEMVDSLNMLSEYIVYAEPNWIYHSHAITHYNECAVNADDDEYDVNQKSLHFNPNETDVDVDINPDPGNNNVTQVQYNVTNNANINIEGAWDREVGDETIRVGVIDNGIRWQHPDLGKQFGVVVKGGFNYHENKSVAQSNIGHSTGALPHGTPVAGIIGAIHNNNKGVSGIAGGDDNNSIKGVSLYDFMLENGNSFSGNRVLSALADAITYLPWRCDIVNMSFGVGQYSPTEKRLIQFGYRNGITFIASRGNADGTVSQGMSDPEGLSYPATHPDNIIMSVGASGFNGQRKHKGTGSPDKTWESAYNLDIDVLAPGEQGMTWTTSLHTTQFFAIVSHTYDFFGGTSCAAPHVAGLTALMQSNYLNTMTLTPDDNEHLIQKYADDRGNTVGYDNESGYGLINATNTLNGLSSPNYLLQHYNNNAITGSVPTSLIASNAIINVQNNCETLDTLYKIPNGQYYANIYELTPTFSYSTPTGMILDDAWVVNSQVGTMALPPLVGNEYELDCKTFAPHAEIVSANATNATLKGYLVYINGNTNGTPFTAWFPSGAQFTFSLYWKQGSTSVENLNNILDFQLYPNPTDKQLNIEIANNNISQSQIEILDIQGKILRIVSTNTTKTQIETKDFAKGFYLLRLSNSRGIATKTFIIN